MDVTRPRRTRSERLRKAAYPAVVVLIVGGALFGATRLRPAAPTVEMSTLWPDTVKRGPMIRQVRGLGRLTPEEVVWIPAAFECRVDSIKHRAGAVLKANEIIMTLSNPDMELA